MKRFFRALFWRSNPKAGMLFSILLGAIIWAVLLPLGLYAFVWVPSVTGFVSDVMESFSGYTSKEPMYWVLILPALLLLYMFTLSWLYAAHLIRRAFRCNKVIAGSVALVLANPVILLVCAVKMRNRRALLALAWVVGIAVASLAIMCLPEFGLRTGMLQLLSISMIGVYLAAVAAMPDTQRTPRWAYTPLPCYIISAVVLAVMGANLERRANRLDAEVSQLSGIRWTQEDAIAFYTNGVPLSAEPYATLLNTEVFNRHHFRPNDYTNRHTRVKLTEDQINQFKDFTTTNATILALLDTATDLENYHPARDHLPTYEDLIGYLPMTAIIGWADFYRLKLYIAAQEGDTETALACLRRLRNIFTWFAASHAPIDGRVFRGLHAGLIHELSLILPQLPDGILPEMQNDLQTTNDNLAEKMMFHLMHQQITANMFLSFMEAGLIDKKANAKLIPGLPQIVAIWRNWERLAFADYNRQIFLLLKQGMPGLYDVMQDFEFNVFEQLPPMLPVFKKTSTSAYQFLVHVDTLSTAFAGIAVERYRRAHGKLPESLDALVPEFLDKIPLSVINGEPLLYRSGEFEVSRGHEVTFTNIGYQVYGPVYMKRYGKYEHFTVTLEAENQRTPP